MDQLGKKTRTAEQLRALVQLRIDDLPCVRQRARDRMTLPVAGLPYRRADSWSVLVSQVADDVDRDVARVVEAMRREYELG